MSDISDPSPRIKYTPIPSRTAAPTTVQTPVRTPLPPPAAVVTLRRARATSLFLFLSFFFFFLFFFPPSSFQPDLVKDDSAENGMPLAFLISAFFRPLAPRGSLSAERPRRTPRYRRRSSVPRTLVGENIHIRLLASRFLRVSTLLPLPTPFPLSGSLSRS